MKAYNLSFEKSYTRVMEMRVNGQPTAYKIETLKCDKISLMGLKLY